MSDKILWRLVKQVYESENNGELVEEAIVEIERLRSRVEKLEKVRAAAQDLEGYGFGWLHWEEKFETLRSALREAKP